MKSIKKMKKNCKGQAIVEYIIIIVIVAVAALTVMGIFSDRIRTMIAGVASTFGSDDAAGEVDTGALEIMQDLDEDGLDFDGSD